MGALLVVACTGATSGTTTVPTTTSVPSTAPPEASTTTTAPPPTDTPRLDVLPADIVLHNGKVVTVDKDFTIAEAVAITGGDIVAVGTSPDLLNRVGSDTTVVDLGGRTVVPGFIDPHTHTLQILAYNSNLEAMRTAQTDLLAGGTTTIGSPNVKPDDLTGFMAFEPELIVRNHLYLTYDDECGDAGFGDYYLEHDFSHDPELRQTIAGAKMFTDGGVCNAPAFSDPYPDTVPDSLKARGFVGNGDLYLTSEQIASVVEAVDAAGGITVIHAIGDEANRIALNGLEQAYEERPFVNPQRIDHNSATTLLTEDELKIYGRLGMTPAVFSVPWANGCDPAATDAWRAILPASVFDVIEDSAALRAANPDLRISWHGDAPSIPGQPLQLMFTAITGGAVNIDTGDVCYPDAWSEHHTVSAEEGVRMLTINAAAAMGIDSRVGSIEVGKVADLLVLAEDPLGPDPEVAIALNHPLVTMINGQVYFCDGDLCDDFNDVIAHPGSGSAQAPVEGLMVTASGFRDTHTPDLVLDGLAEGDSFWSSGADPPGWIEVEFDEPMTLSGLRFVVFQNPPSDTVHLLEVRVGGEWSEATTFEGFTTTGDVLQWEPTQPLAGVEAFRITTQESLSWPEWYEFEILSGS